jgi:ribosome biogenesis GTPase / thiamine phosphate phosphatase
MDLERLGWTSSFEEAFRSFVAEGLRPARVASAHTHLYRLYHEAGECLAEVAGRLRHEAAGPQDFPAVGDWVAASFPAGDGRAVVHAVLPRRTRFSRKMPGSVTEEQVLAANVDTVFLVGGLDGDFNPRRLERALVLAWESGADPVILLSKADLAADVEARRREAEAVAGGMAVHVVSSLRGEGLAAVRAYLGVGRTVALLGSSGVGKSTLINRLLGEERFATASVRAHDDRGRHTTTHRELVVLPEGGLVIDTPGLREIQLWSAAGGLERAFDDVQSLAAVCRFTDCAHESEPGCAVRAAEADGRLSPERLQSYFKLQRELRHLEVRQSHQLQSEQKAKWKAIHKAARRHRPRE